MYKVSQLVVYPIKSLGGVSVKTAKALTEGFEHDRRWMLIDENGKFMSQRENAKMALFQTQISEKGISVTIGSDTIAVPYATHEDPALKVSVWNSKLKAQEVKQSISEWFSDQLKMNIKLVAMTSVSSRYKRLFKPPFKTHVSFADGYPYLILGEKSLENLNDKLDTPVKIDRFRANIIVSSQEPHEEDDWEEIEVGTAQMKVIKPCARCNVVTINQKTAEAGKEPLKTLSTYRKNKNKIYFGANVIVLKEGKISVGDRINF